MRIAWALLVLLLGPAAAVAQEEVGAVERLAGSATATNAAGSAVLAEGSPIHRDDVVATAAASRMEIGFVDGTRLSIGERAELRIDDFVFREGSAGNSIALAVTGPFRYVSGAVGGGSEGNAEVTTPLATIGLRGTDFWGGPIDGAFGVFLFAGAVAVTTAGGTTVLDASGEGMNVAEAAEAPPEVTIWPPDKVARALATVTIP